MALFRQNEMEGCVVGMVYPATKDSILETAERNKAAQEELDILASLPEGEYRSQAEIMEALASVGEKEEIEED